MIYRRLRIHGRVQGVFYRGWSVDAARRLGLVGWVRNRRDGTVETLVAGDDEAVRRFIAMCGDGPAAARVDRIDESEADVEPLADFTQRPTE
ncbi:acylphosphatase [Sphingomonas laterariae]|uniref:acylphosphatase n=1 Tax=Edaphosphingomonas laterariae TaxID=861865 RepID=A0A239DU72_9SPHN|nr:acylphosphatase [Sphingomonas laterariae]SNS35671.1 acylphosphatase [Sphingomonas laterariae]